MSLQALLIALTGAGLAGLLAWKPIKLPKRNIHFIGVTGRRQTARLNMRSGILTALLPRSIVGLWGVFIGFGRGPVGERLLAEEPTLAGIEGLRWRMLFAGYRNNDIAWLRRRQLKIAVAVVLLGITAGSLFNFSAVIYVILPIVAVAAGIVFVRLELGWKVEHRRRRIRAEAVHYFYGLASFLAATMPIEDALRDLVEGEETELAYETRRLLLQVGAGTPITRAFLVFAARCNTDEVTMAVNRINVALTSGTTALATSLRVIAQQCRQTIAASRVIRRKQAVQRNYAFLAVTAIPAIIVATAAPSIYQAFHSL